METQKKKVSFKVEPKEVVMWKKALKNNKNHIAQLEHQIEDFSMELEAQKALAPIFEIKLKQAEENAKTLDSSNEKL